MQIHMIVTTCVTTCIIMELTQTAAGRALVTTVAAKTKTIAHLTRSITPSTCNAVRLVLHPLQAHPLQLLQPQLQLLQPLPLRLEPSVVIR